MSGMVLITAMAALMAGIVKGFTGFGGALVMAPLFALTLGPRETLGTVVAVNLVTAWQLLRPSWRDMQRDIVLPMASASAIATPLGIVAVMMLDPQAGRRVIGFGVLACGLALIGGWRRRGAPRLSGTLLVGAFGGILNGLAGIGGPPAALWLLAGQEGASRDRAGLIVYVALTQSATALLAIGTGALGLAALERTFWLAPLYVLGTILGARLFTAVPEKAARQAVILLVILLGALAALR